jgi:hypothetical protein
MDEEWVSILVPRSRVREFYKLIVETPPAMGDGDAVTAPDDMAAAEVVRRAYLESPPPLRRFLDLLASRPDEWVTTAEVMAATGLTSRQWPQALSALARRGRTRYGRQRGAWPFRGEKSYEAGRQTWRYLMPREYADIVRSLED